MDESWLSWRGQTSFDIFIVEYTKFSSVLWPIISPSFGHRSLFYITVCTESSLFAQLLVKVSASASVTKITHDLLTMRYPILFQRLTVRSYGERHRRQSVRIFWLLFTAGRVTSRLCVRVWMTAIWHKILVAFTLRFESFCRKNLCYYICYFHCIMGAAVV